MANHPPYWFWKDVLSSKEVKHLNQFIMKNYLCEEEKSRAATSANGKSKKNVKTYVVNYKKIKNYISKLLEKAYDTNTKGYDFDLWPYKDEDICLYNIYSSDKKADYDWHIDGDNKAYCDIKFTLLINLSEENFEGGNLYLQENNDIPVPELKERGSMVFFKSHIRHMVTPVTKGERRNLVVFLTGPNFK
tara:strand:+ start:3944 stop:4513 length:570 start_codon:yes stop_codon:yes gene_type:complete